MKNSKDNEIVANWFCKKHGLQGTVGQDWCFGCYKLDEDSEMPVPHIGYKEINNLPTNKGKEI